MSQEAVNENEIKEQQQVENVAKEEQDASKKKR